METCNSYVKFSLCGDDFDPKIITEKIGLEPTRCWRKGDKGEYNPDLKYSCWTISTEKGKEYINIDKLVDEIVTRLSDKIEIIIELKQIFNLHSVLGIVLDIDTNQDKSTPAIGHDLKTIDFLYRTQTTTDIDIYRFDSSIK